MNKSFQLPKRTSRCGLKDRILIILMPALLLAFNRFGYLLARLITHTTFTNGSGFFEGALPIDHEIPFVDFFVIPYILAYVYGLVIPFVIYGIMGKKAFYRFVAATFLAELLGFICLILLPSKLTYDDYVIRESYSDHPLYGLMNKLIYNNDLPDNLAPSFHVLATLLPFIACLGVNHKKKHNGGMISGTGFAFILITLATLFVRQHYVVDIFSAMLLVALAYLVVRVGKGDNFFAKISDGGFIKLNLVLPTKKVINKNKVILPKHSHGEIACTVLFITCSIVIISGMLYFGAVSCITGDPFQSLGKFGIDSLG